ncbi:MAG: YfhO family protein, partial [Anaerolineae bacterium]
APTADAAGPAHTEILAYTAEEIRICAHLSSPGYLLLTDAYYPGWQAHVNGQPVSILRADLYFRAIPLDAGLHEVSLDYHPQSLRSGTWIALVALAAWISAALLLAIRRLRAAQ